jgi:3-oxoacyl-[acyl-carrier-protein] synthase-1
MTGVSLRASALASALGSDLAAAVSSALEHAEPQERRIHAGRDWPYRAIPVEGSSWRERAEAIARHVALDLRQRAGLAPARWSSLPCIIGSSSYSVGEGDTTGWPALEMPLAFGAALANWFEVGGPLMAVNTACTSGLGALEIAANFVRDGTFPEVLVLGVELVNRLTLAGFAGLDLLSPSAARPCDRDRDGLVLGEAFAALVLCAGPGPWGIRAQALGVDAASLTGPAPEGTVIAQTMNRALTEARWPADTVDLVKLQAGGSPLADLAEARAVHAVFAPPPCVASLKGALGHTLGASGPAELALLLACLDRGRVPPTFGYERRDDELGLEPSPGDVSSVRRVLFNLSGFGGSVMTLALERNA